MSARQFIALTLISIVAPLTAQADEAPALPNEFTRATFRLTDTDAELTLQARALPGETRIHSRRGFIRVWFANMTGDSFLESEADGTSIRWVRVRPGAAETSVIYLRIGDNRRVEPEAIRIERSGNRAVIRIARNLLPALPPPPPVVEPAPAAAPVALASAKPSPAAKTAAAPAADSAVAPAVVEPPVAAAAADAPSTATQVDGVAPANAEAAAAEAAPAAAASASTAGAPSETSGIRERLAKARTKTKTRSRAPHKPRLGPLAADTGIGMGMLLLVTCGLGLAYMLIKKYQSKHARPWLAQSIEIVGLKRLGNKHQLVVVRALGEDHLISVHGGHTEVIASAPIKEGAQQPQTSASPQEQRRGLLHRVRDRLNPTRRILDGVADADPPRLTDPPTAAPSATPTLHAPQFGAELLRFAVQKTQPMDPQALSQAADDSAVAGIIRLRERFGRS